MSKKEEYQNLEHMIQDDAKDHSCQLISTYSTAVK